MTDQEKEFLPNPNEVLNLGSQTLSSEVAEEIDMNLDFNKSASVDSVIGASADSDMTTMDLTSIAKMVPDRMAFKIGDVAEIAGIKPYVLRYWESEFEALNPQKSAFNQRVYSKKDVETVLLIKKLLYEEKFSIAGAKKKIREVRKELKAEKQWLEVTDKMDSLSDKLQDLAGEIALFKRYFQ